MKYTLIIIGFFLVIACNPKNTEQNNDKTSEVSKEQDTLVLIKKDSSLKHTLLYKYFPPIIKNYKTIGYPDANDKPTGLPTGETASSYTFPKYISFAKHLYVRNGRSIAIEILDYNIERDAINGYKKMFSLDSIYENAVESNFLYNLKIAKTKASYKVFKQENKYEMHIVVCDRFVININILGEENGLSILKNVAAEIPVNLLIKDYCN